MGGRKWGRTLDEKEKGLSTNWQLQNSHRDVKYSKGNTGSNIVITMYGARVGTRLTG